MKKYLLAMALAVTASFSANASYIQGVSGAELAGIEVTVDFLAGGSESATWVSTSSTAGGAFGASDWSVTLDGDSFGEFDPSTSTYYGLFEVFASFDIMSITLDMLGTGLVFDTAYGMASGNGSGAGREMVVDLPQYTVTYSNLVEDELYSTVTIDGIFEEGSVTGFLTDVDAAAEDVPAPAGLALLGLGLLGMRLSRRNK